MVAFANPVAGIIRPPGSPLIVGNFRVVCDFACHQARVPPVKGVDIGDVTCGKPILAMTSGVISYIKPGVVGSTASLDASIFRIKRPDGWEPAVAHLRIQAGLAVGQAIAEGTQIGTLDKIGATSCHVHVGCKDPTGTEVDVWPLLKQNGALDGDEMVPIPPGKFVPLANKSTSLVSNAKFRAERLTTAPVLKIYPVGTAFVPLMQADDGSPAGGATPTRWYAGFGLDDRGFAIFGWFHSVTCGPLVDTAPPADCSDEVAAATAPLNLKIENAQKALA